MVHIYGMRVLPECRIEENLGRYLSEERWELAQKRRSEKERRQFLSAEILLNRCMELEGISIPVTYRRNRHGKPYLSEYHQLFVNWSHSDDYVLCAVADREIGIDLQKLDRKITDALVRRLLDQKEQEFYWKLPKEIQFLWFYRYWAVKESFLKAVGTGFSVSLDLCSVEWEQEQPVIHQKVNDRLYDCRLLHFCDPQYQAAVCVEGTLEKTEERKIIML